MSVRKKKVVHNEQFFLRIQPDLQYKNGLIKEPVSVDFTPNVLRKENEDFFIVNVTPQFNKDGLVYTHAFTSEYEMEKHDKNGGSANSKENFEKKRMELAEKRKIDIFEPLPGRRHKTCGICMVSFNDYLEHLNEPTHQQKLNTNKILKKVKDEYMKNITNERDNKIRQLLSKKCGITPKPCLENQFETLNLSVKSSQKPNSSKTNSSEKIYLRLQVNQKKATDGGYPPIKESPKIEEKRISEFGTTKSIKKRTYQEVALCQEEEAEGNRGLENEIPKIFKNNDGEKIYLTKLANGEILDDSIWNNLKRNLKDFVCDIKHKLMSNPIFSRATTSKDS